mgnify:CR=1 FL=1
MKQADGNLRRDKDAYEHEHIHTQDIYDIHPQYRRYVSIYQFGYIEAFIVNDHHHDIQRGEKKEGVLARASLLNGDGKPINCQQVRWNVRDAFKCQRQQPLHA